MRLNEENRHFYKEVLGVGVPVMLQQLIMVAVSLCDTIMVGNLSEVALAAVGAANQVFIVYIDCIFGLLSGISVLSIQYWGIKDLAMLRRLLGIGFSIVLAVGIPVTVIVYCFAPFFVGLFSDDPEVVLLGTQYIKVAVFTYVIGAMTFVFSYSSRVISKLKWPTVFNAVAVAVNIFLNWCLIYGHCGLPELGVRGAAYATLAARILEFILMLGYVYLSKEHPLKAKPHELKFDGALFVRVVRTAGPVVINELLWVLSFTLTFAIYGKISPVALAVVQIAMTISDVFQSIYFGLGNGCAVVVGKELGRGNRDKAFQYAKKCINITWILNVVMTSLLILSRGFIINIYNFEASTNELIWSALLVYAVAMTPKMFAYLFICGILRTGGDTVWATFADAGLNWLVQVPLAWLSVVVWGFDLPVCIAIVAVGDLVKTIACYIRFYSKKWINVFTGR